LVESSLRKALFLEEAASELGLRNVRVLRARWQNVIPAWAELVTLRGLRIDETERDRILESLSPGGRLLWFSGRERLLEQGRLLRERPGLRIRGPVRLLPKGGFLLLAERRQARDGP
jgi:16S rRNA G527 N7-methylase RsmG